MNPHKRAFENPNFIGDPDENLFRESLADLDTKYSFPETLSDYFQRLIIKFFLSNI